MKRISQQEFDALPIKDGIRICPGRTDYSAICIFNERCRFGESCRFGERCRFGEGCCFGERCRFGAGCSFGKGCRIDGTQLVLLDTCVYSASGFGSQDRITYGFATADSVWVRCGCWAGLLPAFRKRVKATKKGVLRKEYLLIADLFQVRWDRLREFCNV
ncbi:MAG: hypothetical protein GX565_01045 [Lentisphaerae bacterium]|nr:hypothetical protein [Lentisphaerota bacterium]